MPAPVGSANYEKLQAKYSLSKDFSSININKKGQPVPGYNQEMNNSGTGDDGFVHLSPNRSRVRQRSINNNNMFSASKNMESDFNQSRPG